MKRLLFLLLFLPIFSFGQNQVPPSTKSVGDYDQTIRARDTLFTDYHFVYRDTVIPVLDISYHEFSSDSLNWHKPWVTGDVYIRISNDVKNAWKVLNILSLSDPLWARDSIGGIYNFANNYDVHVMNDLNVEDSINTNNFYFLNGDSLKITWLNARDGSTGDILQNINGVAYWMPITSVFDSAGFYDAQNNNIGGVGVWDVTNENVFYFRGIDGSDCITAILDDATNRIVIAFDPTCLSVTAGIGLSGGGVFDASGNVIVNLSIPELTTATSYDSTDWFAMYDVSLGSHRKVHISEITGGTPSTDSVFWIAANDGSIDTVFNNYPLYFEEGDTTINIEVSGDSVIFSVNGCPVPPGGLAGQVLVKLSDADCDLGWVNLCDVVAACDTLDLVAEMCEFAAPYIDAVVPTTGFLNVGALVSDNETIGDYVIDWYLNGIINFTSATSGAGITNYILQPMNIPVESGMYTPIIRWVEINGVRYTSTFNSQGVYSSDLLDCLDPIYAEPYSCANGGAYGWYGNYNHELVYTYTGSIGETPDRTVDFVIGSDTKYVAWYFWANSVVDTIWVYYDRGGTRTLLQAWAVGTANSSTDYTADIKKYDAVSISKIEAIDSFSYQSGDKIIFDISPSFLATDWTLRFACVDSFVSDVCDPITKLANAIDTTHGVIVTWDSVLCRYNAHWNYMSSLPEVNDITKYMYPYIGNTISQSTTLSWNTTTGTGGYIFANNICDSFYDSITFRYANDTLNIISANPTDWTRVKYLINSFITHPRIITYTSDSLSMNHYKLIDLWATSIKDQCPSDEAGESVPEFMSFYDGTNITFDEANKTVSLVQINQTNPFTLKDCNNDSLAVQTNINIVAANMSTASYEYKTKNMAYSWYANVMSQGVNAQDSSSISTTLSINSALYDLCDTVDMCLTGTNYISSRMYTIKIQNASDPLLGVDNYELWKNWDEMNCVYSPTMIYKKVNGVGTWY